MTTRRMSPDQRAKLFKALSDPRRVEMIDLLAKHGEMCGTELAEQLGISVAMVSHHWEILIDAGVFVKHRQGQLRFCALDASKLREAIEGWDACRERCAEVVKAPAEPLSAAKPTSKPAVAKKARKAKKAKKAA